MTEKFSRHDFEANGYQVVEKLYSTNEIVRITELIERLPLEQAFGVREFLDQYPELQELIFTPNLKALVKEISPNCRKSIKSIYFDKPPTANWIVNWHQDLTINLKEKKECESFINWRVKGNRTIVQPPLSILDNIFTIRIHLDDCTAQNGAVRVIPKSHKKGVINISQWVKNKTGEELTCQVKKGGVMLMKPLTLHASRRTENDARRRVIHIEFTADELPDGLQWKEKISF